MELTSGDKLLGIWLIISPDQGRRACRPCSVLGQLFTVRLKHECLG